MRCCDSSGATMLHMDSGGFMAIKGMNISLKAQMRMMSGGEASVQNLMICGEKKLTMQIGEGGDNTIIMKAGTDIKSALISHKADSTPAAQPSPSGERRTKPTR